MTEWYYMVFGARRTTMVVMRYWFQCSIAHKAAIVGEQLAAPLGGAFDGARPWREIQLSRPTKQLKFLPRAPPVQRS